MKTHKTTELIEHMYKMLENPTKKLTDWELSFLDSTKQYFDSTGHLSDKQFEVLERICSEKTE